MQMPEHGQESVLGYDAIARSLADVEARTVFAMLGGTNVPWLAQAQAQYGVDVVKTRHEDTAVMGAVGYARATGRTGFATVTRGPGFANSVNALIAAVKTHAPIVVIVGQSPSADPATRQNVNQSGIANLIGAGFRLIGTDDWPICVYDAVDDARSQGVPQVVSIEDGLLESAVEWPDVGYRRRDRGQPVPASINAAAQAIRRAQRPLLLAGWGAVLADAGEPIRELGKLLGANLATTVLANRFFTGDSRDLGVSGGWAPRAVRDHISQSDVVVAFGSSLDAHTFGHGLLESKTLIHCDVQHVAPAFDVVQKIDVVGDARLAAEAIHARLLELGHDTAAQLQTAPSRSEVVRSVLEADADRLPDDGLDLREVYAEFERVLPEDRIVVSDSGRTLPPLVSLLSARDANSFIVGRGYGSTGLGLGHAIGASAAHPDRPVVLFAGDGGFLMSSHDLDAVRLNDLNVTVVIMNDRQYGSEVKPLLEFGFPPDFAKAPGPDFVRLAEAFGGRGVVVSELDEIADLPIREEQRGLLLVDVQISRTLDGRDALGPPREERSHLHTVGR